MTYGVPYMGSKNACAKQIAEILPQRRNFYDLFAGGCAVTHAAILSNKFRNFICNDLQGAGVQLFCDAIAGKYHDNKEWISREDFSKRKDTDPLVALCWSFGNDMRTYMYAAELEDWKHALHRAYALDDPTELWAMGLQPTGNVFEWIKKHQDECRDKYIQYFFESRSMPVPTDEDRHKTEELLNATQKDALIMLQTAFKESGLRPKNINEHTGTYMFSHWFTRNQWLFPTPEMYAILCEILPTLPDSHSYEYVYLTQRLQRLQRLQSLQNLQNLQSLPSLQRLQRLQRLQSLQSLQSLPSLQRLQLSYDKVEIMPDSLIYCDPPYAGTAEYITGSFDNDAFFDWCRKQTELVVVSEYAAPDDFECVATFGRKSLLQGGTTNKKEKQERLWVRKDQLHIFNSQKLF